VNQQVGFTGRVKEEEKMEHALELLSTEMYGFAEAAQCVFTDEDCDVCEIDFSYDPEEYKVEDIRCMWREIKNKAKGVKV
tara:strand:+ start:199 stop:438 length:240 start_codon:yes stop_codon:yes gene_type:complete